MVTLEEKNKVLNVFKKLDKPNCSINIKYILNEINTDNVMSMISVVLDYYYGKVYIVQNNNEKLSKQKSMSMYNKLFLKEDINIIEQIYNKYMKTSFDLYKNIKQYFINKFPNQFIYKKLSTEKKLPYSYYDSSSITINSIKVKFYEELITIPIYQFDFFNLNHINKIEQYCILNNYIFTDGKIIKLKIKNITSNQIIKLIDFLIEIKN